MMYKFILQVNWLMHLWNTSSFFWGVGNFIGSSAKRFKGKLNAILGYLTVFASPIGTILLVLLEIEE